MERISDLLSEKKISQKQFMADLKLSTATFSEWKAGRVKSYKKYIEEIADYLGVSVDYLLGRTDDPHPAISNDDVKNAIDEYVKSKGKQSTVIRYNGKEQTYETLDMTDEEWEIAQATIEALRLKRK